MVLSGKLARVAAAAIIPVAAVVVAVGPASAGGGVDAKGTLTCNLASSFTFTPPLSPFPGTLGAKKEVVKMGPAALSDCAGTLTAGLLPTGGAQTKATTIKVKGLKRLPGGGKAAGSCPSFLDLSWPKFKPTYEWTTGAAPDAATKIKVAKGGTWGTDAGLDSLTFSGKAKGSFAGTVAIHAVFDSPSTTALTNCLGGTGKVSTAEFDSSMSTITFTPKA